LLEQHQREFRENLAELESVGLKASVIRAEAAIEGSKHRAEALKQQVTYSAGAILAIAAITTGLLPSGQVLTTLLWLAYSMLLITIAISLLLQHAEASRIEYTFRTGRERVVIIPGSQGWRQERVRKWPYVASLFGLPVVILIFGVFITFNLKQLLA